ncbi:MAG: 4-hydroxy-3-methylbut-2-enyl diphosphate reductase, partial [Verrucomicrobia bacterium]
MKVIVAEHFGICFGVRDAIAQAQALAREAPLTILGELVHNPIVRE